MNESPSFKAYPRSSWQKQKQILVSICPVRSHQPHSCLIYPQAVYNLQNLHATTFFEARLHMCQESMVASCKSAISNMCRQYKSLSIPKILPMGMLMSNLMLLLAMYAVMGISVLANIARWVQQHPQNLADYARDYSHIIWSKHEQLDTNKLWYITSLITRKYSYDCECYNCTPDRRCTLP